MRTAILALFLAGCGSGSDRYSRELVSGEVERRSGLGLGPERPPGETALPAGVRLEDGVSEREAVAVALWNNAAFQEALAGLGLARADLDQAGLLSNPVFSILFPVGPKQLEYALKLPLEALHLRPRRLAVADKECERIAASLVQNGLDLVRDVQRAWHSAREAERVAALEAERAGLRNRIAGLVEARLRAGDVSELQAQEARIAAQRAQADAARAREEIAVLRSRFRSLLGLDAVPGGGPMGAPVLTEKPEELERRALASRPDLRAAEIAIEAAGERAGLVRAEFISIAGILDANDPRGKDSAEVGPGVEVAIPLFDRHEARRARADAELDRAARRYLSVRHAVLREVGESAARLRQAEEAHEAWAARIVPSAERALRQARRAQELGETAPSDALEAELRWVEARLGAARAEADWYRAGAELERSVGGRIP